MELRPCRPEKRGGGPGGEKSWTDTGYEVFSVKRHSTTVFFVIDSRHGKPATRRPGVTLDTPELP